ncbi:hypothetical protein SD81_012830 [Tolypothrix campylonemoides VB511288]|nr:hypothetical protein SD81_012830 [Tolypothrix campylonemoides VB511288]
MRQFIYLMVEIVVLDAFLSYGTQPQNQVLDSNTVEFRTQEPRQASTKTTFPAEVTGVQK